MTNDELQHAKYLCAIIKNTDIEFPEYSILNQIVREYFSACLTYIDQLLVENEQLRKIIYHMEYGEQYK